MEAVRCEAMVAGGRGGRGVPEESAESVAERAATGMSLLGIAGLCIAPRGSVRRCGEPVHIGGVSVSYNHLTPPTILRVFFQLGVPLTNQQ